MKSLLEMWVWESGLKIDPATGVMLARTLTDSEKVARVTPCHGPPVKLPGTPWGRPIFDFLFVIERNVWLYAYIFLYTYMHVHVQIYVPSNGRKF